MKKYLIWIVILLFTSCTESAEDNMWFRVKRVDNNVIDIVKLNNNYKTGDRVKTSISNETCIVEILNRATDSIGTVIYTDKIQYIKIDSIKKGDTIMMNNFSDTLVLSKHNGELKSKYILK